MGDASTSAAPATPTSTLICLEDGNDLFLDDDSPAGGLADSRLAADDGLLLLDRDDEYVALMLSKEGAGAGAGACGEELDEWTKAARAVCVDWIVKTNARFLFSGKTAYVAVTYLDRFLAQRRVDRGKEWALQLLSVACLSLAAKVEEHRVPRLPEFRPDEYDFDSASILRMELLVLGTLKWQMIAGTPFPYLSCFASRFRHDERRAIVLRAVKCIFASIKGQTIPPSIPFSHRIGSDHKKSSLVCVCVCSDELGGVPAVDHGAGVDPGRARRQGGDGDGPEPRGGAQGDPGLIMAAITHRACVFLLQRDDPGGGQV
uniref:Cyclin-like domain-containing protein n=1 Tax=Aegilops tauschii subsp. strangulata TaxID=200361 RepID=A0A453IQR2_AEGTS